MDLTLTQTIHNFTNIHYVIPHGMSHFQHSRYVALMHLLSRWSVYYLNWSHSQVGPAPVRFFYANLLHTVGQFMMTIRRKLKFYS